MFLGFYLTVRESGFTNDGGIDVSAETNEGHHRLKGRHKGAKMELQVLAVFDPLEVAVRLRLAMEGLHVDCLHDDNWHLPILPAIDISIL
jgi:hypothetical protein